MKPAGFWVRFWAVCIDGLIFIPFSGANMLASRMNARDGMIAISVIGALLANVYPSYCHWRWGRTLGKYFLDIRVLSVDGARLSGLQSALRSSIDIGISFLSVGVSVLILLSIPAEGFSSKVYNIQLAAAPALWGVIGLSTVWCITTAFSVVFHPEKRAVHDLIAGTKAVRPVGQLPAQASAEPAPNP